jgi:hypothetical protein
MTIRTDITASHDRVWEGLAAPGARLTGAERVAVAAESRNARACRLCQGRKAALSPNSLTGEHDAGTEDMSPARVELIHKLVTDPGRITRSWVEGLLAAGMSDVEYVEIAALASAVMVVDTFHVAMDLPLRPLPEPVAGEPSGKRPRTAVMEEGYVPVIPADALTDDYADLYDTRYWVPNVHRAFSLVPDATRLADELMSSHYFPYEMVPRYTDADHNYAINKMQIELIASRVSMYNDCFY